MGKIIIFGHSWITEFLIKALLRENILPELIVSLSKDKSKGVSGYNDLSETAVKNSIKIYHPESYSLKSKKDQDYFNNLDYDFGLVYGWSRLIPEIIINTAKYGFIGVHGGPFPPPRCRGRAVFNWAIIDGHQKFYIYLFQITPGIDDGKIFIIKNFNISEFDDIQSVYDKNSIISSQMFIELLSNWDNYKDIGIEQDNENATYLPGRKPDDGGICWYDSTLDIYNFIRALTNPFPNAFTKISNNRLYIQSSIPFDDIKIPRSIPGTITYVFSNGNFIVETGDGFIYINKYYSERKIIISDNDILESFPKQRNNNIY